MRKALCLVCLLVTLATPALAYERTTVLSVPYAKAGMIPFADGLRSEALQKQANAYVEVAAKELLKEAGEGAQVSFTETLAKPTVYSVILQATGEKTCYKGINIDVTTGKACDSSDFFYLKEGFRALVPTDDYVFGREGVHVRTEQGGPYDKVVPYTELLPYINIANGARVLPSVKLTPQAHGKSLAAKVGEMLVFALPSSPTTGYDWHLLEGGKLPGLVNMGSCFTMDRTPNRMVGTSGTTTCVLSFAKAGEYDILFGYKRLWEKGKPEQEVRLHISVVAP